MAPPHPRRRRRPRRPKDLPPGASLVILLAQCLIIRWHPRCVLMVQPFAIGSITVAGGPSGHASSRPSGRRTTRITAGTDEGIGEIERTNIKDGTEEKGEEAGEDGTKTIGQIHNAKYINGLIETLESVLDKWIVSGAMATVSTINDNVIIYPLVSVRSFISLPLKTWHYRVIVLMIEEASVQHPETNRTPFHGRRIGDEGEAHGKQVGHAFGCAAAAAAGGTHTRRGAAAAVIVIANEYDDERHREAHGSNDKHQDQGGERE